MLRYCFSLTFIINFLILFFTCQVSSADTAVNEFTTGSVDSSQLSDPTLQTSSSGASNLPTQSASIYQNYGYGSNPLNYPNCGGFCAFGVVRLTPNNNGKLNPEAIMGVVMQFDSPEKRLATGEQNYNQARSNRMAQEDEVSLLTKLADAVEQCKDAHANLLAIAAAKRLGMTPEELLSRVYKQSRQCNSHSSP
ncbi:hypothetical protein G7B40_038340 [Aetokthonos hydrillicola Thurmond2011]|jgi:hypothetical protein|uniref:Uncharacterized protein n=1 Tax=Aetokthonos hydrillicola Thurmond2011 TaxID=2712845 RepID=A0AAP5IGB6_9CYAN|nr:hypothetical protein [Aetokthonos hydrillicola]MBO3462417.1 hypothetical protein [Aetokthonos hydrillicola CCALA 1050]MBW4590625.1 hypothetical protein [Aetokthonos hydrillicola CCALA 1050]MDR9900367.1 hypothetical protein [Aetokthonos hydrillicola Thurmond2011]